MTCVVLAWRCGGSGASTVVRKPNANVEIFVRAVQGQSHLIGKHTPVEARARWGYAFSHSGSRGGGRCGFSWLYNCPSHITAWTFVKSALGYYTTGSAAMLATDGPMSPCPLPDFRTALPRAYLAKFPLLANDVHLRPTCHSQAFAHIVELSLWTTRHDRVSKPSAGVSSRCLNIYGVHCPLSTAS